MHAPIYALGLVLYEMVAGLPAFEGDTPIALALKQLRSYPKRPREVAPTLPVHAEELILKCLQKDPAKRCQSIDELLTEFHKQADGKATLSRTRVTSVSQ